MCNSLLVNHIVHLLDCLFVTIVTLLSLQLERWSHGPVLHREDLIHSPFDVSIQIQPLDHFKPMQPHSSSKLVYSLHHFAHQLLIQTHVHQALLDFTSSPKDRARGMISLGLGAAIATRQFS